jgi:hypothetical protein
LVGEEMRQIVGLAVVTEAALILEDVATNCGNTGRIGDRLVIVDCDCAAKFGGPAELSANIAYDWQSSLRDLIYSAKRSGSHWPRAPQGCDPGQYRGEVGEAFGGVKVALRWGWNELLCLIASAILVPRQHGRSFVALGNGRAWRAAVFPPVREFHAAGSGRGLTVRVSDIRRRLAEVCEGFLAFMESDFGGEPMRDAFGGLSRG